jgi:protocatechuate 3,4-dioxygenase beta subunit
MNPQPHLPEEHDDDQPVGRVLSRREILKLFAGGGAALVTTAGIFRLGLAQISTRTPSVTPTATSIPTCVVKPELTEGPYFVDTLLNRSDIRADSVTEVAREGVPFTLTYRVSDVSSGTCDPLEGAMVDIWHCDALGVYSGVASEGTAGEDWLRGHQLTDEYGVAEFITIYPGWYSGRAVHIHFKIRTEPDADAGYEFTSQLFFDDEFSYTVYDENEPYSERGRQNRLNSQDGIFQSSDGMLTLTVTEDEETGALSALFDIGLDLRDAG